MKKSCRLRISFFLIGLLFSGCVTTVPIRTTILPEVDLTPYSNLAVMEPYTVFIFNGNTPYGSVNADLGEANNAKIIIGSIASYSIKSYQKLETDSSKKMDVNTLDLIVTQLEKSGFFKVYRPETFLPAKGNNGSTKDFFEKTAANTEIDAFLVPYVVCNLILDYSHTWVGWDLNTSTTATMTVKFGYKIFDLQGTMVVDHRFIETLVRENTSVGVKQLQEEMYADIMKNKLQKMMTRILPRQIVVSVELLQDKTKNPLMIEAEKLVRQKNYSQANELYIQIFADSKNPAAAINAAIMFRALDEWDIGLQWLKEANNNNPDKSLEIEIIKMESELKMQYK